MLFWLIIVLNKAHKIEIENFTFLKMYAGQKIPFK